MDPIVTSVTCDDPANGGSVVVNFGYKNTNSVYRYHTFSDQDCYVIIEESGHSRKLQIKDVWANPYQPYAGYLTFNPNTTMNNLFTYTRTGTAAKPVKPFQVKFFLEGNVQELDYCHAVIPTLDYVESDCNGNYIAHFGYINQYSVAQTLPTPSSPNNVWNYFTDQTGARFTPAGAMTTFDPGSHPDCYEITFSGPDITWHLTTHSITAKASLATNLTSCITGTPWTVNHPVDFFYRPYPVLLVHGYNATPVTWGAVTAKNADDRWNPKAVSTRLHTYNTTAGDSKFAEILAENIYGSAGSVPYKDYKTDTGYFATLGPARYSPFEEDSSYIDSNHTYVEHYGASYAFESDDARDALRFVAPADYTGSCNTSPYPCYNLKAYKDFVAVGESQYGGQTQLVRTRIIQLLNEYYGDWKWLYDPTAKINIVVHSNGGLIVTK